MNSIKLILLGDVKSTQHCYKMTCRGKFASMYMSKECKDLKEDYQWQIKSQYRGQLLTGNLQVWLKIYFGTKRKQDIDNFNKLIFDSMTGLCYEDDSQIQILHIIKDYDKDNPRIDVIIEEI